MWWPFKAKSLDTVIKETVKDTLDKNLGRIVEETLPKVMMDMFEKEPHSPLNELGFNWALALYLRKVWPSVTNQEAVQWLREYIGVPFGSKGYDWDAAAAKLVAYEYVNEVGEIN